MASESSSLSEQPNNAFVVDMTELIPLAINVNSVEGELSNADVTAFNQDEFERGVQQQLDKQMAIEEAIRAAKLLEKQLATARKELRSVRTRLEQRTPDQSKGDKQRLVNEEKKLDAQCSKLESQLWRLSKQGQKSVSDGEMPMGDEAESKEDHSMETALGLKGPRSETETERRIRLGEMTPFGSSVRDSSVQPYAGSMPRPARQGSDGMTEFERYLADQAQKSQKKGGGKPSKTFAASTSVDTEKSSSKNEIKRKRRDEAKLSKAAASKSSANKQRVHEDRGHGSMKEKEEEWSGGSEYEPDDDDEEDASSDDADDDDEESDTDDRRRAGKAVRGKRKMRELSSSDYSSDDEDRRRKAKVKKRAKKLTGDDGILANYQARISEWKKQRLVERQRKAEKGDPDSSDLSDVEVEGGLKMRGKMWNKLYRYQKTAVQWLWELHCQQTGGILGDEMGLGKTIEIIAFLAALGISKIRDKGTNDRYVGLGPTLIVCPATVMFQWVREINTWWPQRRVAVLHATGTFECSEESFVYNMVQCHGIVVTSFSNVLRQRTLLLKYNWHYIILDEGHKIRNPDAQITLACKQFRTVHRLILSGSPIQNNLKELWSLFDFIFPGKLGTLPDFMQHFSIPIAHGGYANASDVQVLTAYKCACILRDTINPYLLRRLKADVNATIQLPAKNEQVLFCRLTDHQRDVYKEYLDSKQCQQILKGDFLVFPGLITLRKICNHPDLATGGPKVFSEEGGKGGGGADGEDAAKIVNDAGVTTDEDETLRYGYWRRSGKMKVLDSLLRMWRRQGHKVLLFSQTCQMLNIIEDYVQQQQYPYLRMDGSTNIASRQSLVNTFNVDPNLFVFLLTTRVGGIGVNLTGANRVVIYDPDWNPSTDSQARERAWRIGQTRDVTVYRLLTTGTIEEKIYHRQIFKQFLTNRVLKDPRQRRFFKSNDLFELFTLADDDKAQRTETGSIFSGTGSSVKVKKLRNDASRGQVNRFDVLQEMASVDRSMSLSNDGNDGNDAEGEEVEEEARNSIRLSDDKIRAMQELARKISARMSGVSSKKTEPGSGETAANQTCDNRITQSSTMSISAAKGNKQTSSGKKPGADPAAGKKQRRRKDAKVEGQRITGLSRQSVYQPGGGVTAHDGSGGEGDSAQQDDYVLRKLFKKSNVHSALQHDKIMMSSNPDYLLVEKEADRVAKDAADALKRSREAARSLPLGVPTWTGQHGGAQAAKPRFGRVKNTALLPATTAAHPAESSSSSSVGHLDGAALVRKPQSSAFSGDHHLLSSNELLARMRARNHTDDDAGDNNVAVNSGSSQDTSRALSSGASSAGIGSADVVYLDLAEDLRMYLAFGARTDGQATTQEVMDKFGPKISPNDSAKFRALLKQLCEFVRLDGVGTWKLRAEFR